VVTSPSWEFACRRTRSNAFKRFALGFQVGLRIVVGGVEADVPEPASYHRDIDPCRDQMYGSSVPKAVRRDVLRGQTRYDLSRSLDVFSELEADA
jgi:hypothetical protein